MDLALSIAPLITKSQNPDKRKYLAEMAAALCAANAYMSDSGERRRKGRPEEDPKESYLAVSMALVQAEKCAKAAAGIIVGSRELAECQSAILMTAEIWCAIPPLLSLRKSFYQMCYDGGEALDLFDSGKWKGRYEIFVTDSSGNTVCSVPGAREFARVFGISFKSAADRLSRVFRENGGRSSGKVVLGGKKYEIWFVKDEE